MEGEKENLEKEKVKLKEMGRPVAQGEGGLNEED